MLVFFLGSRLERSRNVPKDFPQPENLPLLSSRCYCISSVGFFQFSLVSCLVLRFLQGFRLVGRKKYCLIQQPNERTVLWVLCNPFYTFLWGLSKVSKISSRHLWPIRSLGSDLTMFSLVFCLSHLSILQ